MVGIELCVCLNICIGLNGETSHQRCWKQIPAWLCDHQKESESETGSVFLTVIDFMMQNECWSSDSTRWEPLVLTGRHQQLTHPEEVVLHADGKLVSPQPEQAHGGGGEFGNTAAHAGQLAAQQLLPVQRGLMGRQQHSRQHVIKASVAE